MLKRACPFAGDLQPQFKIHVGQKQVNNGVSSNKRMKEVYGKRYIFQQVFSLSLSLLHDIYLGQMNCNCALKILNKFAILV